ncbi:hypothetical protein [Streptomyces sp. NBC_01361]|uniref:hypothetical protein n=1 Tax=Streptomyces sp. NBC_01361 TaxID=2903838 RepID=UPI002E348D54|nr:hypothetical protein [Streptomyces sp. NBC_01361]
MESLSFSYDSPKRGGVDITLSLSPEELAALGPDAQDLADWLDTAVWTLAMLRTGLNHRPTAYTDATPTKSQWHIAVRDLYHLISRIEGIRDAAVRHHQADGGSINDLVRAMDCAKSTAQSRRNKILGSSPSHWENWAEVDGGPENRPPKATPSRKTN